MINPRNFLLSCMVLCAAACGRNENNTSKTQINIIPLPVDLNVQPGTFRLSPGLTIYYDQHSFEFTAGYLKEVLEKICGFEVDTAFVKNPDTKNGMIFLTKDNGISEKEGYHLQTDQNVIISGNSSQGIFYGVQTLLQLVSAGHFTDGNVEIPKIKVSDYPRFTWRGMHLDVSRHFFSKEFIKKYIDMLALHKMNKFHWHLVDDQGWRIEIKKYPKLTTKGAWRVDREHLPWNERPPQKPGEEATYGGFYTQDEIKEIVDYAAKRHIEVVPEIEMPAHVSSALAAYPEYSCKGTPISVPPGGVWPITDIYCAGKEETFEFLEDILTEVMELFPSEFIHIGGDEADKTEWKTCVACQRRIKEEGLKNEHELQSYFIRRIDRFLTSHGRRLIGWDEILDGGLAENATVMSWRGEQGGIAAAKMAHDVVMTPASHCYFDYYQSLDKEIEPIAFGGFIDLHKVYTYEPVPEQLTHEEAKYVLGAQGNVWTEYISSGSHVEYMTIPRMTALSEVLWTPANQRNYQNFVERLEHFLNFSSFFNINYHIPAPELLSEMIFIDSFNISLEKPWPFGEIFYTLDGSTPSVHSAAFTSPVTVSENGEIKAVFVLENGKTSKVKTGIFTKKKPLAPIKNDSSVVQGLRFRYLEGNISSLRYFNKLAYKRSGQLNQVALPETELADQFGLEIDGLIKISSTGIYTFTLVSDDGSQLFIDNQLVVDADGLHGPEPSSGQVALASGYHHLIVRYFEAGGGEALEAYIHGPGMNKQQIPQQLLYSFE